MLAALMARVFSITLLFLLIGVANPSMVRSAFAQDKPPVGAIKTLDGYLLVWNRPDFHFTVSIKGKDVKPLNDTEHVFFNVDGLVFQVQLASISEFVPGAKDKKLDDRSILAAHRDWESKFIENLLHSKIKVQSFNARLSNGSDALMWQFDLPEGFNSDAKKQLFSPWSAKITCSCLMG